MNVDYHHEDDTASGHTVGVTHHHTVGVACSLGVQSVQDRKAFEGEIDKRILQLGWDDGIPEDVDRGRQQQQK